MIGMRVGSLRPAVGICALALTCALGASTAPVLEQRPTAASSTAAPVASVDQAGTAAALAARATSSARVYQRFPASAPTAAPTSARVAASTSAPRPAASSSGAADADPHPCRPTPDLPWCVGAAKESVDPSRDEIASHQLHLGGYGLGPTRATTGPLVDGDGTVEDIYARALAITNKDGDTLLLGALENQGTFAADKQGPFGIFDIRQEVSARTGVPVDMIVVNSDHSHAGPDLIGLWGGVPVSYLQRVHDQAVKALEEAFDARRPARLLVGADTPVMPSPATGGYVPGTATPGEFLVHSQFGADTQTGYPADQVDTQLRVLEAVDGDGRPMATLINYAAHATVMDGSNLQYSADWPGRVARATEQSLHEPVALTMVADVGRSQPPRPNSDAQCDKAGHVSCNVDKLDTYTRLLAPWVLEAVRTASAVKGTEVEGEEVLTRETATNPALVGVSYSGEVPVRGYGAYRSATTPWIAGNVIGADVSVHRVGDLMLTAAPGEAYPDIRFGLAASVQPPQAIFTFGLANDQLGYIIAPATEYGWITTSNPGNDNSFFNVAPQYGDHVLCTMTYEAKNLGFRLTGNPAPYGSAAPAPACAALTATDVLPAGPAPQQPWPFGDGAALPSPAPQ
jgi:hypothetical protein